MRNLSNLLKSFKLLEIHRSARVFCELTYRGYGRIRSGWREALLAWFSYLSTPSSTPHVLTPLLPRLLSSTLPPDMVASSNGDLYTPFPHMSGIEEGVQSSEEGSDLHSPIFEASYATQDGTRTLSRRTAYNAHMSIWYKKPGIITLVTSNTMFLFLTSCYHRRPTLTLVIPLRLWTRIPEIPISWRHYSSRALRPCTIIYHLIRIPTWFCMDTRCSI